ncbi:MAG: methyltransferase domain-containing protein [Candidatus Pacebacteria bacterium]|nr:methyltransferase domain-containing protein [Candidatus Paceibacterota bacterium]
MQSKDFKRHRIDVVSGLSGIGLEIGFGSGLNLPYYKSITRLYGLDPSKELYEMAHKNLQAVTFPIEQILGSAEHIPLPENSLDFVVSTWTLCTIPHPDLALKEVFRVLKPGGKFCFIEHGKSPKTFIWRIQNLLTPISKCIAGGCHLNRDIEHLIRDAGFKIQNLEKFSQGPKPLGFMYKGVGIKSL